jgi:hypothetical protein
VRQGPLRLGYATHRDRSSPDGARRIDDPWRRCAGRRPIAAVAPGFRDIQAATASARSAASPRRAAPTRRSTSSRRWCGRLRQQQRRHLRPGLPLPHRLRPQPDLRHLGRHPGLRVGRAGRRHARHRRQPHRRPPGLRLAAEEAAAQGAKLIVADPRRIDLVRSPHVEAAYHLPLRPGTNVAFVNALAHVIVTEGLSTKAFRRERCETSRSLPGRLHRRPEHSPEATEHHRHPGADCAAPPAVCHGAATARSTTASASPSTARARRWSWAWPTSPCSPATRPRGRRRQPAARPEQRAGLVRHGLLPARAARLPPRVRSPRCASIRERLGRHAAGRAGPAHPQHVRRGDRRSFKGSTSRARTSPSPTPTPSTSRRRCARWSWSSCRTCSSTRRRGSRTSSCRAPRSWRRTAPSPTPSAASTGCAR